MRGHFPKMLVYFTRSINALVFASWCTLRQWYHLILLHSSMLNVLMALTYGPSNTTADHSGVPPNQTKVKEPALLITRNNINKGQYLLWIQTVFEDGRHLRETPSVYRVGLFMGSLSTRGGTRRTGRTLYVRIIVQFIVCQVCVSGVKPEQEVNRHPVVAASPTAISTTKPLLSHMIQH